jgi:hypothetical protein
MSKCNENVRWRTYKGEYHEAEVEGAGEFPLWASLVGLPLLYHNLTHGSNTSDEEKWHNVFILKWINQWTLSVSSW